MPGLGRHRLAGSSSDQHVTATCSMNRFIALAVGL
jgi:hypothetical protein